jgi:uncharacterized membrane protein
MTDATINEKNKRLTLAVYCLYSLSPLTAGFTSFIAIVINYVKRDDVKGTWLDTHFKWQISTFWWSLALSIVGLITAVVGVGLVVLFVVGLWVVYRVVKGILYLKDNKPMYAPKGAISAPVTGG